MELPTLELEITKKVRNMNADQQDEIMQFINTVSSDSIKRENYRKKAISEIRKALKTI